VGRLTGVKENWEKSIRERGGEERVAANLAVCLGHEEDQFGLGKKKGVISSGKKKGTAGPKIVPE